MLEVRPTDNVEDIKAVLAHPEIWATTAFDAAGDVDKYDWGRYFEGLRYARVFGGYVGGNPVAMVICRPFLDGEKVHIQVIPEFRKKHSRSFGEAVCQYAHVNWYAEIPDIFPNVQRFAEANGFVEIGRGESNKTKNGVPLSVRRYKRTSNE